MLTYLLNRNDNYHVRIRIPSDLTAAHHVVTRLCSFSNPQKELRMISWAHVPKVSSPSR